MMVAQVAENSSENSECDIHTVSILGKPSIRLGFHLSPYIASTVTSQLVSSTYVLITDSNLASSHGEALRSAFELSLQHQQSTDSARFLTYTIPPGEQSKSRETKAEIEDWLLDQRCTRDTVILALGGGVVGDLVGFVAATFMRGVRFCQIPTSLLAMVDSSVGGKTAIDTPLGKNLVGAFWQPSFVFIDVSYLETLPEREFVNGMAEVIKTAAIWDQSQFVKLEVNVESIRSAVLSPPPRDLRNPYPGRSLSTRSRAQRLLLEVIADSVGVKAEVVTKDEKETGLRNLVNFGHTIGHAIEAVLTPDLLHGECISVGMILEAEVARSKGCITSSVCARLSKCLKSHGLPISLSDPRITRSPKSIGLIPDRLLDLMSVDKKNAGKLKKVVLLSGIGKTFEDKATGIEDDIIKTVLCPAIRVFSRKTASSSPKITITTPGSKSISNRALVLAALGHGTCKLKNLLHSDDTQVMISALEIMKGASFAWEDNGATLIVTGHGGKLQPPPSGQEVYLGNAGTAARFLTTVCTLVQSESADPSATVITGNERMKQRPIGPLVDALSSNGVQIDYLGTTGCLPLKIDTLTGFPGGQIELSASVSSQYVSSILLSAPYALQPVTLSLVGGTVISQPYIDMTIAMMSSFGIKVERLVDPTTKELLNIYKIPKGIYKNPDVYEIESDASSATYPLALAGLNGITLTVASIGSGSLQGDAQFAKKVLEPMGCQVIQTEKDTTVTGPKSIHGLRQLGHIDMETMTDAFLTACVVLGLATQPSLDDGQSRSTKITGIANQRVKECDRIAAMVKELGKLGIKAEELEDGIEVFGTSIESLTTEVQRIDCYDDHRVAMAFSVLGSTPGWKGLILNEKRCVEKTWPSWWDDLSNKLGIKVEGVEGPSQAGSMNSPTEPPPAWETKEPESPSILLCGMRGCGKSFCGRLAAGTLGWPLIDTDLYFQNRHQTTIRDYIKSHGWSEFRNQEVKVLNEILQKFPIQHVISLGGGIVEGEEGRQILKDYANCKGPVIQITRPLNEIIDYLDQDGSRPSLGEPIEQIWERRNPWYRECSNSEYFNLNHLASNLSPDEDADQARRAMRQFFNFTTGVDTNHLNLDPPVPANTHFLSLTFPSLSPCRPEDLPSLRRFQEVTLGCDAVELRVDLLSVDGRPPSEPSVPPTEFVLSQIAALRRLTTLPIIHTVRTRSQGGMFPDDREDEWFELVSLGIRSGCEYVDVEFGHSVSRTDALVKRKGHCKIIASFHDFTGNLKWNSIEMRGKYRSLKTYGDFVKLVTRATDSLLDNFELMNFRSKIAHSDQRTLITINMGRAGQMSRILSPVLSPTTHPLLPGPPAAPGQLSFEQIQQALDLLGQTEPKSFWLFGSPIGHSRSPLLHQTGFDLLGYKGYQYRAFETDKVEEVEQKIRASDFGGASVTIPLKVDIIKYLDRLTPDARAIGAVNTIVPIRRPGKKTELLGANTDWQAIRNKIMDHLPSQEAIGENSSPEEKMVRSVGLVIGAGGTARAAIYAIHSLGFKKIYLCNRTKSKAEGLAKGYPIEYGIIPIGNLEEMKEKPSVIVSAVPSNGTSLWDEKKEGTIEIKKKVFERIGGGVVIEMSYKESKKKEERNECGILRGLNRMRNEGWIGIDGLEILFEQGIEQFKIWTGGKSIDLEMVFDKMIGN